MAGVCPFCALRCESFDIDWSRQAEQGAQACRLQVAALTAIDREARDEVVCGAASAAAAGEWLRRRLRGGSGKRWVIGGTVIDLQGARSAVKMAVELRGMLEGGSAESGKAFLEVVERQGFIGASLGELTQRGDTLFFIGDVFGDYPRLIANWLERLTHTSDGLPRQYVFLGQSHQRGQFEAALSPSKLPGIFVDIDSLPLHRWLAKLRAFLRFGASSQPSASVQQVARLIENSPYSAWFWSANALTVPSASLLGELIMDLNRKQRAVLVPLSEDTILRQVTSWLTGVGLPVEFHSGLPRLVDRRWESKPELRVWLMPYPSAVPPPEDDDCELLVVGLPSESVRQRASVWVRAAIPGVEIGGSTVRGDGTVGLPLGVQRQGIELPSVARLLSEWTQTALLAEEIRC